MALVERLPPEARARWDACEQRCMNIGVEAGSEDRAGYFPISAATVAKLAAVGAEVALTVYANEEPTPELDDEEL